MRILLVTDGMELGGAETHIAMLAKGLSELGQEVAVFSCGGRSSDRLEREGFPQYRYAPVGHSPSRILALRGRLRGLATSLGVSVLHAHARIPALLLRGCRRWEGSPAPIVTIHAAFSSSLLSRAVGYWGERTIAVSEDLRALACDRFGVPAEQITVIPNGIDLCRFSPPVHFPPPHSILFASRLDRDCSVGAELLCELLPRLAHRYPDLSVTVAGGGNALPILQKKVLEARRETLPPVRFLGAVEDMPSLYRSHSLFVGVSRAAMEAASCGCAVLLCGNEGYGGLLSPASPLPSLSNFCCRGMEKPTADALFSDIVRLLDDPSRCREAAELGGAWIRGSFDHGEMANRTLAVYRSVAFCQDAKEGRAQS